MSSELSKYSTIVATTDDVCFGRKSFALFREEELRAEIIGIVDETVPLSVDPRASEDVGNREVRRGEDHKNDLGWHVKVVGRHVERLR
jgi:hypothetical protein